jgi:penicillin-insensitive murein endopeptidase
MNDQDRVLWKDMQKPVSLEEHSGELPGPIPRPSRPADDWVQLPQGPEAGESGSGYYTYGKMPPGMSGTKADYQWGEPRTMQVIQSVAGHLANGPQFTPFGVGNISLAGGRKGDHDTHMDGLGIDVRPARKDGMTGPLATVDYRHADYDCAATRRLLEGFIATGRVKSILFNDPELYNDPVLKKYIRRYDGHNDHFHVQLLPE